MKSRADAVLAVTPATSSLRYLDPVVQAFCRNKALPPEQVNRLSFAVDAVVAYCFRVLHDNKDDSLVHLIFQSDANYLEVMVEYGTERGNIEPYFRHGCRGKKFKVTSFEALGLYVARELVQSIEFSSSLHQENSFRLRIPVRNEPPAAPETPA